MQSWVLTLQLVLGPVMETTLQYCLSESFCNTLPLLILCYEHLFKSWMKRNLILFHLQSALIH